MSLTRYFQNKPYRENLTERFKLKKNERYLLVARETSNKEHGAYQKCTEWLLRVTTPLVLKQLTLIYYLGKPK